MTRTLAGSWLAGAWLCALCTPWWPLAVLAMTAGCTPQPGAYLRDSRGAARFYCLDGAELPACQTYVKDTAP